MPEEINAGVSEDAAEVTEDINAEESTSDADAEEAGEGTDETGDTPETEGESDEEKHKRLSGYQRTKRKLQKAEQEREFWRTEALRTRSSDKPAQTEQAETPAPPVELKAPTKPRQEDYESWELFEAAKDQYTEDLAEFKVQKALEGERQRQREDQQRQKLSTELDTARKRYEDFDKVAGPTLKTLMNDKTIHEVVRAAIGNSPMFADLLYVIGSESKEAKALLETARRDPIAAVEQIGVLKRMIAEERASITSRPKPSPEGDDEEAELEDAGEESAESARPPDKKPAVIRAPEPIPPVRKGAPVAKSIYDPKLPYTEYVKLREAGKNS